ncbi:MAG: Na+/H+ antiporter NhaC family protein, partial [Schwartzia sp.]|nr:Na+/H+ antiporter NhaC family protein [Schwartzia sp. (in: firmicutes)]
MAETVWAVFPPMLTIVLALATKEVYMSLLIGIFSGAMLYTDFNVLQTILTMFAVMEEKVGKNVNI